MHNFFSFFLFCSLLVQTGRRWKLFFLEFKQLKFQCSPHLGGINYLICLPIKMGRWRGFVRRQYLFEQFDLCSNTHLQKLREFLIFNPSIFSGKLNLVSFLCFVIPARSYACIMATILEFKLYINWMACEANSFACTAKYFDIWKLFLRKLVSIYLTFAPCLHFFSFLFYAFVYSS